MELQAITIKNFRSITKASRVPLTRSTVLLGPNNEGKSNVLRALVIAMQAALGRKPRRVLGPSWGRSPEDVYDWDRDFPISLHSNTTGQSEFVLEFGLTEEDENGFWEEVGSRVKSPLPIQVVLGGGGGPPQIAFRKKGPGSRKITQKHPRISEFLAKRLDFDYIPAVRNADAAQTVVKHMVVRALQQLDDDASFRAAQDKIRELQQPILNELALSLKHTLLQFLPTVKSVEIEPDRYQTDSIRRIDILIDDGVKTELRYKGDGIQSLAALALMRKATEAGATKKIILALEEPESHLHPKSIQELREIISQISTSQQVILTTHCPLFADRQSPERNVIVQRGKAREARNLTEVRTVLGVRAADNLLHADLVLVVEGEDDRDAIMALFRNRSPLLSQAIKSNRLAIDSIGGAGKLSYKLGLLRDAVCDVFCYLDGDSAGAKAVADAEAEGLLPAGRSLLARLAHLDEAEFEDLLDESFILSALSARFAISTYRVPTGVRKRKWSERMKALFDNLGQPFHEAAVKRAVADAVVATPGSALRETTQSGFDNLVTSLERLVTRPPL